MVAQADGVIDPSEKQKIFGYARNIEFLKVFDVDDIIKEFDKFCAPYNFDPDIGKQDAMSQLSKLTASMDTEQRKCILVVACAVGKVDGNFDDTEKAVAREIRTVLGLSDKDVPI